MTVAAMEGAPPSGRVLVVGDAGVDLILRGAQGLVSAALSVDAH